MLCFLSSWKNTLFLYKKRHKSLKITFTKVITIVIYGSVTRNPNVTRPTSVHFKKNMLKFSGYIFKEMTKKLWSKYFAPINLLLQTNQKSNYFNLNILLFIENKLCHDYEYQNPDCVILISYCHFLQFLIVWMKEI